MVRLRIDSSMLVLGVLLGVIAGFAPLEPAISKCHKAPLTQLFNENQQDDEWKSIADLEGKSDIKKIGSVVARCEIEPSHFPGCASAQIESPVPREVAVDGLVESRGPPTLGV